MEVTEKAKKAEALARMKMLGIHKNAINEFDKERRLNYSEPTGALYWLTPEMQEIVNKFEQKWCMVYHVIRSPTAYGEMFSLLYVGNELTEWGMDREDIKHNMAFVYVYNKSDPDLSEFGTIGIEPRFGGVIRTY